MRAALSLVILGLAAAAQGAQGPVPIILISVDTLRADHLSCYGSRGRRTPNIDAIANGGTLFSQANAQVPLTLPSHVSLLTSRYPFASRIEDNGQLVPSGAVTLATILKSHGYRTAAFIGGFVLDRRFGLNQGFDVYDSPFALSDQAETDAGNLKRLGEDVSRTASDWIDKNAGAPFFVFLHLFDLHTPENLPKAIRARFPGPRYDAELGYIDEVLGKFWSFLGKRGVLDKALVVFLADHGESLGEHGENTHGYFIYQSTLSVPLIFHWPVGGTRAPPKVDEPVSLMDVAPTILHFLNFPVPNSFQGKTLPRLDAQASPEPHQIYSESLYSHNHFNTSALLSLRVGKYKYIQAPKPEFYDLTADPEERHNLYSAQIPAASDYRRQLNTLRARYAPKSAPTANPATAETVARLRSLGYLAGTSANSGSLTTGPDPKDRIADYSKYRHALTLATAGSLHESNTLLEGILSDDPGLLEVRNMLGLNYQHLGEHDAAAKNFREVVEKDPLNAGAHLNLATSYSRLNRLNEALREAQAAIAAASGAGSASEHIMIPAKEMVGAIRVNNAEYDQARAEYTGLLTIAPADYEAHYNLAWLDSREGHTAEAFVHLQAAVKSNPASSLAHNALGSIYLQRKELEHAGEEFGEAVRLDPRFVFARYNLGLVLQLQGAKDAAAEQFREALKVDPQFQPARAALTRMGLN
jgi:tetratricopeptide (TPR) repeat protein